ncbi:MAG: DNA polymerase zeta [Pleopsidium flavum]|nr:MAG: DNA polymerase zeta [Pleopsidium flavum]
MELFRVRLNCVDHYQALRTDLDPQVPSGNGASQRQNASKVPVIRVFGATETGQKVCAHIHGAFPYLYVEYSGSLVPDEVNAYIRRLHLSVDHALAVSYRRNVYDGKSTFVAHITLVKGIPFYGYHVGYKFFLKVYMLNPMHMTRLADLLRQGTVMKKVIQPYESHMQYLAQWMCDYNLYGCAYIDFSKVKFRNPVPDKMEMNSTVHQWHDQSIQPDMISDEEKFPRQSHCSIEVDVCVQNIMNRQEIKPREIHHDFIERTNPLALDEKLVHSMAGLWRDETKRRKARMGDADPGSSPFPPEVLVSVSADPRNSQRGGWIHEEEYMERARTIIRDERSKSDGRKVAFDGFVRKAPFEGKVKTTLESVEDLYPENLAEIAMLEKISQQKPIDINEIGEAEVEVDESRILKCDIDDFPYESDEDLARDLDLSHRKQGDQSEEKHVVDGGPQIENDDELRSDGDGYAEQFRNPIDHAESLAPNSSSELEAMGIRKAGDMSHFQEDAFEIPKEYTSDITAGVAREKRARALTSQTERNSKRRKVIHGQRSPSLEAFKIPTSSGNRDDYERPPFAEPSRPVNGTHNTGVIHPQPFVSIDLAGQDSQRRSTVKAPKPFSQEKLKANELSGNKTLSFQVVKDPQDPGTVQRLSQQSNSPLKSSQSSVEKHVSWSDTTGQTKSIYKRSNSILTSSTGSSSEESFHHPQVLEGLHLSFGLPTSSKIFCFAQSPPAASLIPSMMKEANLPSIVYQDAFYSEEQDVPERAREYAGKEFKLGSRTVPYLPDFDRTGTSAWNAGEKPGIIVDRVAEEKAFQKRRKACKLKTWEIGDGPPRREEVARWVEKEQYLLDTTVGKHKDSDTAETKPGANGDLSQIEGPTQKNRHGFKYSQKQNSTSVQHETQYMSIMSVEVHINTRGSLIPNPEQDEIACIFWCLQSDDEDLELNGVVEGTHVGILALSEDGGLARKISQQTDVEVEKESTELDLITRMVDIVRYHDPDILTGYEVHGGSWGYMIERARYKYDYNLCDEFSRMKSQSHGRFGKDDDKWGFNHTSTIRVTGRHMINIWRAMRGELNLLQYTMENVVFHLLHRRIPHYAYQDLTIWYNNTKPRDLAKVIDYYVSKVQLDLEILEQNELISRTSEQARLLGVDFFSVFSRGSQFKVESLMFRIAKPENLLLISPSRKQVGQQNALECLPLVMEPQSAFYNSPLLVLDFQSLYPSVMIAYNYCYSTFLGRVVNWRGQNKMGFTDFNREPRLLELFKDQINIAPNGMMYVRPEIRKSLLAKMLGEILETRVMVKSGMKVDRDDKTLQRLLNNRQLALKLIANVTYGYTSASFSGRMPCSEIADSIVQTGRETLEKAIALIHSVDRWGAEVVYGDTDSLFVYLKGRTKEEAFDIGKEIADTITKMNPRPVKLKFEKVYLPCVLLAKKRYVGFKYESMSQKEPDFDAKGIETVRRDGTPAEQKIEEKALKILFRTADLSQVKSYFQRQCTKIMKGKISIQDFCFAKEVKLGTYSERGLPPPGALISTKRMLEDPRAEPQYGERVPYVVITGAPGARLIDRCVAPEVLLQNDQNELDAEYYISKNVIPPLERIFNLVGANVRQWYDEMPKFQRIRRIESILLTKSKEQIVSKKTLESYMKSSLCLVCRDKLEAELPICSKCLERANTSLLVLRSRLLKAEKKAAQLEKVCRSCAGFPWGEANKCDSKDCPVFYTRTRHMASLGSMKGIIEPVIGVLEEAGGGVFDW